MTGDCERLTRQTATATATALPAIALATEVYCLSLESIVTAAISRS